MNLNYQNKLKQNAQGFTLLEVLIAMAILVFIAFSIYQATTQTFRLRDILSTEGAFYNNIRFATTVMWRDLSMIYSPLITINYKKPEPTNPTDQQQMQVIMSSDNRGDFLTQTFTFWSPAVEVSGLRPSRFIGTEDKISFISISHIRIYRDKPESEFAKVTYEIKKEKSTSDNPTPSSFILIKTESPNAFALDEHKYTLQRSYDILHGIKKLTYSYHMRDGNTWKTFRSWDSDKEETKNQFPDMIELKLEVTGPKNLNFEGIYKFRPEIPFNGLNSTL